MKFIVALTDHRHLGNIFVPCLAEERYTGLFITRVLRSAESCEPDYALNDSEKEIIRLTAKTTTANLSARFSREGNPKEFFTSAGTDYLKKQVLPFAEKQMYKVALILRSGNIPVYRKEARYSSVYPEDLIVVPEEFAGVRFEFQKLPDKTEYRLKIFAGGREIPVLNRNGLTISTDPCVMLVSDKLLIFKDIDARKIHPFLHRDVVTIPKQSEEKYFRSFVSGVVANWDVQAAGFEITDLNQPPEVHLSFEPSLSFRPVLLPTFLYGPVTFGFGDIRKRIVRFEQTDGSYTFTRIHRDEARETGIIRFLEELGLKERSGAFTLPNLDLLDIDQAIYYLVEWLSSRKKVLDEKGITIIQDHYTKRYFTGLQEIRLEIKGKSDWFDVYAEVQLGEFHFPFIKLRKYILNDIREFELPNGEIAILPEEWFSRYKFLIPFAKGDGYILNFQKHHYNLLRISGGILNPERLSELDELAGRLAQLAPPQELKTNLRNYQLTGYRWLYTLFRGSMGGCLADDMGLGKTVQAIAFLLKIRKIRKSGLAHAARPDGQLSLFRDAGEEKSQPASLVVMPTSLVHNWASELERFAPVLKVYKHTGIQRTAAWNSLKPVDVCDVILTTYGTLRNDILLFRETEFFCLILDESQMIKNPFSKTYHAVNELKAKHRLVLTGTPVENSLSDLWAQMNFLNRGLLGTFPYFRNNFINRIESHSDVEAGEKLQLLIRPFILRRTKVEVAGDLPDLMEQTIFCTMSAEQATAYEKEKSVIRNTILTAIENKGITRSSIVILQGLTRLRQLANHPRLLNPESRDESGKFGEILEYLGNIIAENHKVLVFSSFVTHLELVREELEKRKWKYSLLTGQSRDRKTIIDRFQAEPDNHIFLISLKAGGVGLNLTSADYVFILDPWWNPAVEDQAVSRAHRIGQNRHVFVYRFICAESVEEKIMQLKERKNALAEQFINRNDPFVKWTEEEILTLL